MVSGNPLAGPRFPHLSHEETPQAHFARLVGRIRSPLCKKAVKHVGTERPLCSGALHPTQACALPGQTSLGLSQSPGFTVLGLRACRAPSPPATVGLCPNPSPGPAAFMDYCLGDRQSCPGQGGL